MEVGRSVGGRAGRLVGSAPLVGGVGVAVVVVVVGGGGGVGGG